MSRGGTSTRFRFQQPTKPAKRLFKGLVGVQPEVQREAAPAPGPLKGAALDEDSVRQNLGLSEPERKRKIPDSYRQLLNLDPQDILDFFDTKIGERTDFAQVDFGVSSSMLEHRIKRLQKIIGRSKQIIEGMSAHIIKLRRGKDDPLLDDKKAREKHKRDENARIARCNAKIFRYRTALRSGNYHEKIWASIAKPVYFRDVVDDQMCFETVTDVRYEETDAVFAGGIHTHNRLELFEYFNRRCVSLESYRAIMKLDSEALQELGETDESMSESWRNLRHWENEMIRSAVRLGVIAPRRDLAELLGLAAVVDEPGPVEADTAEDALAIKTGGACYGGRIKGEGYRYRSGKITPRKLSSFDKPQRTMSTDGAICDDPGFGSLREINDDMESYVPN